MTLEQARDVASKQAKPHLVWRLPAWPVGVYGVISERPLPSEAEIVKVKSAIQGNLF